jgi:flagellum-specific peptidoglycan hydrolase FlgJ
LISEILTRLIKLLSLALALTIGFLVSDTTTVMAQYSTSSNQTMSENTTMTENATMATNGTMNQNTNSSGTMTSPTINETLATGETVKVTKNETVTSPPLQQLRNGVSVHEIKCANDMQLILKKEDGSPACVKPGDVTTLIERGWASMI